MQTKKGCYIKSLLNNLTAKNWFNKNNKYKKFKTVFLESKLNRVPYPDEIYRPAFYPSPVSYTF